jgi:hypothetical protein
MTGVSESVPRTATGSSTDRNYDGQAIAISVFSTIRPWRNALVPIPGRVLLPIAFALIARIPALTRKARKLSFIHFAHWTLIKRLPYNGAPQPRQKLRYTHMYFESNFNGGWEEYIDAFSHVLTFGMNAFWGSGFGYPKPLPTAPFKAYIKQQEVEAGHYYSAYPQATVTMVRAGLQLSERLARFDRETAGLDAAAFAAAYTELLSDAQGWL